MLYWLLGLRTPITEAQSQSVHPTGNSGWHFDVPHLPTVLEWYLSSVGTIYNLGCSQYRKSDRGAWNRMHNLQLLVFQDQFWEMDRWAIDTPMLYLQKHLLMPADDSELQWQVSKHLQPSTLCRGIIFAKDSLWIQLLPWTFSEPQKSPFGVGECSEWHCISTMYFSLWKTPGVTERMWSVNLEASNSEEYQTLGGYSGRPSE